MWGILEAKKRFTFIDLLKGWALLVMIEVHVVNAFIKPELTDAFWFSILNFINGLVAPSFTFISGFAFVISSKNNLEEMRKFGKKFWKKTGRILLLFVVGYSLHMPEFSYLNIVRYASPESLVKWCNADVLQCIAFSLIVIFTARLAIKQDKAFNGFIFISTIVIMLISPIVWKIDFARFMPMPIACYFNEMHGSFFPLFPWMGFLFAGASACILYMKYRSSEREEYFINKSMLISVIAVIGATIALFFLKKQGSFEIKPDPFFFIQRLAIVLFALGLSWKYVKHFGEHASFVTDVSRESLIVYFLHLQIIYRKIWNGNNLEYYVNFNFGITELIYATLILAASMIAVAKTWGSFKAHFPRFTSAAVILTLAISVVLFFLLT